MKNLQDDAKTFDKDFKKAVEKSTIRHTSREKNAKKLADRFVKQIEEMRKTFDETKKVENKLPAVFQTADQLDRTMQEIGATGLVSSNWRKVQTELDHIAAQFNYPRQG
jgi:phage-related tail protein